MSHAQDTYFSEPSAFFRTATLAPAVQKLFKSSLVTHGASGAVEKVATSTLAGKVVGIYMSASWCGPCRQYTPQLIQFYNQVHNQLYKTDVFLHVTVRQKVKDAILFYSKWIVYVTTAMAGCWSRTCADMVCWGT